MPSGKASIPGRRQIYALLAATLLPVLLFTAAALYLGHDDTRRHAEDDLLSMARMLAQSVDRIIAQETAALTVLATAEELDRADFQAFYVEAKRAVEARDSWKFVTLTNQHHQLLNTRLAYGAELPPLLAPDQVTRVFETAQPQVSGVARHSDRVAQPFVSIRVPVVREGTVRYALTTLLPAWTFNGVLREQAQDSPNPMGMTIIDQTGRVVALDDTTAPSDPRIGTPAGHIDGPSAVAPLSGWRVVVTRPVMASDTVFGMPATRTERALVGSGLLALTVSGLLAAVLASRLRVLHALATRQGAERDLADIANHVPGLIHRHVQLPNGTLLASRTAGALPAETDPIEQALLTPPAPLTVTPLVPIVIERESRSPDGETRWLHWVATPRRQPDGTVLWDGLTLDVTDLRRAEAALRESESRLRMAQEAAGIGSWDWDLPSGRITWSDSLYRLFGAEPGTIDPEVAVFVERVVHPDDRQAVLAKAQQSSLRGGEMQLQYRIVRPDGTVRWMECTGNSVANADGRPVRLLGIIRDITDRKATEEALHAANAALEREVAERTRAETLLETMFASAPAAMTVVDGQLRYLHVNERMAALNALPAEAHIGRRPQDVLPADLVAVVEPLYRRVLSTGEPIHNLSITAPAPADPWTERHWLMNLHPVRNADGTVQAVHGLVQDITDQKTMEASLRTALDEARAAIDAKARFFASASHDLRQPVQTLFLFAHALHERLRDHPAQALVVTMQQALEGMKVLIDTLLDISRLDSGTLEAEPADFPAVTLMQRLSAEYGPRMAAKGLKFRMIGCPVWIRSDAVLLGRVLGNLLDNALKYTERGGVLLACRRRGDTVRIEVWDTGVGIRLEDQVAIFDEFVQLGNTGRSERGHGLGLGLSIVQRLVRLLGHELTLRSRPGRGTVFTITVPITACAPDTPHPPPLLLAGGGPPLAVLVEDDHTILTALGMLLEEWGFEVIAGAAPDDVLEQIAQRRRRPDLIISDYFLSCGRTGTEAIRMIRAYCNAPVPAIVLTGDTGPERALEAGRIGSHLLLKPVMPDVLQDMIQRVAGIPKR
ncbi:hybrid sensor histidine kinase/response regulator [Azospirillum soli]|uniref:hybrid sensor histidine kinase/response regulator n=1 Tax=Azospirillum soli TaxID=1304799 RepID=UPI001AEB668B|nr:hybrid sensor histidine kinase/response regulator [Azospirillum soli]MBP2313460.1 PAS domain S-box-containing protein [Azospirillum soli]